MPKEPRTPLTSSPRWRRTLTVLIAAPLIIAGCGAETQQTATNPRVVAPVAPDQADVEYGASLDEWADAVDPAESDSGSGVQPVNGAQEGYTELDWEDLLPPGYSGDEIYARYEERLNELEDGSPETDAIYAEMQAEYQANSDAINRDLNGTKVNLAGFVAPLNFDDDIITEFLLVPYFGACIHVPAPPPNQTVLVTVDEANGLTFDESWGAVWVVGTLTIDPATTDLATASYTMTDATSGVYEEYG